jgi:hypothetical protein
MISDLLRCADVQATFGGYLTGDLPPAASIAVRDHLDLCQSCWQGWNRLRWQRAADTPLYAELVQYLGEQFTPYLDSSNALADAWDRANPGTPEQVRRFYRDTDAYLYNQVIWHASGNRPHYVEAAKPILAAHHDATIIDYGCGIGEDILALHRVGLRAIGCDLASPPTHFFTWRARRHGYPYPVYQPEDVPATTPFLLWIMDALDHVPDLNSAMGALLDRTQLVICEDLLQTRSHGRQGFHHHRSPSSIDHEFAAHGLRRSPARRTPTGLSVWTRETSRCRDLRPAT